MSTTTKVTTKTTTSSATAKGVIKPRDLSIGDVVDLLRNIKKSIFDTSEPEDREWAIVLALCDSMVKFHEMAAFFPEVFKTESDYKEFFDHYYKGEYDNYISALQGNKYHHLVEEFVETNKSIVMAKLKNPMSDVFSELSSLLHNYSDKFKDIDADDFKKFISEFGKFTESINPETLTEVMLNKAKSKNSK